MPKSGKVDHFPKICKGSQLRASQAAGALFHVPKMQFQPAIDDGFMLYPVLCEELNDQDSVEQVALVILTLTLTQLL
jgi:hypothetical protein